MFFGSAFEAHHEAKIQRLGEPLERTQARFVLPALDPEIAE